MTYPNRTNRTDHDDLRRRAQELLDRQPPEVAGSEGLERLEERPGERQRVRTPDGYEVAVKDDNSVEIYGPDGKRIASIKDNKVFEAKSGEIFGIGDDSTFILPDGTQIAIDLESRGNGRDRTAAVDIISGNDRLHVGRNGADGIYQDGREFDRNNPDAAASNEAGVFALQDDGEFAIHRQDGQFYDVRGANVGDWRELKNIGTTPRADLDKIGSGITNAQRQAVDGAQNAGDFSELLEVLTELLDKLEMLLQDQGGPRGPRDRPDTQAPEGLDRESIEALIKELTEALQGGGPRGTDRDDSTSGPRGGDRTGGGRPPRTDGPSGTPRPGDSGRTGSDTGSRIKDLIASGVDAEILITMIIALLVELLNDKLIEKAQELDDRTRNNVEGGGENGEGGESEGVFGEGQKGTELLSRELQQIQENLSALKLLSNTILDNKNQVAQQLYS